MGKSRKGKDSAPSTNEVLDLRRWASTDIKALSTPASPMGSRTHSRVTSPRRRPRRSISRQPSPRQIRKAGVFFDHVTGKVMDTSYVHQPDTGDSQEKIVYLSPRSKARKKREDVIKMKYYRISDEDLFQAIKEKKESIYLFKLGHMANVNILRTNQEIKEMEGEIERRKVAEQEEARNSKHRKRRKDKKKEPHKRVRENFETIPTLKRYVPGNKPRKVRTPSTSSSSSTSLKHSVEEPTAETSVTQSPAAMSEKYFSDEDIDFDVTYNDDMLTGLENIAPMDQSRNGTPGPHSYLLQVMPKGTYAESDSDVESPRDESTSPIYSTGFKSVTPLRSATGTPVTISPIPSAGASSVTGLPSKGSVKSARSSHPMGSQKASKEKLLRSTYSSVRSMGSRKESKGSSQMMSPKASKQSVRDTNEKKVDDDPDQEEIQGKGHSMLGAVVGAAKAVGTIKRRLKIAKRQSVSELVSFSKTDLMQPSPEALALALKTAFHVDKKDIVTDQGSGASSSSSSSDAESDASSSESAASEQPRKPAKKLKQNRGSLPGRTRRKRSFDSVVTIGSDTNEALEERKERVEEISLEQRIQIRSSRNATVRSVKDVEKELDPNSEVDLQSMDRVKRIRMLTKKNAMEQEYRRIYEMELAMRPLTLQRRREFMEKHVYKNHPAPAAMVYRDQSLYVDYAPPSRPFDNPDLIRAEERKKVMMELYSLKDHDGVIEPYGPPDGRVMGPNRAAIRRYFGMKKEEMDADERGMTSLWDALGQVITQEKAKVDVTRLLVEDINRKDVEDLYSLLMEEDWNEAINGEGNNSKPEEDRAKEDEIRTKRVIRLHAILQALRTIHNRRAGVVDLTWHHGIDEAIKKDDCVVIQALVRGHLVRKMWKKLALMSPMRRYETAALKIQKVYMGHVARRWVKWFKNLIFFTIYNAAATTIQKAFRGHIGVATKKFKEVDRLFYYYRQTFGLFKKKYRAHLSLRNRKEKVERVWFIRANRMATRIQKIFRGHQTMKVYKKLRAVIWIQKTIAKDTAFLRKCASQLIQGQWRRHRKFKRMKMMTAEKGIEVYKRAIPVIQALFRGALSRRRAVQLRHHILSRYQRIIWKAWGNHVNLRNGKKMLATLVLHKQIERVRRLQRFLKWNAFMKKRFNTHDFFIVRYTMRRKISARKVQRAWRQHLLFRAIKLNTVAREYKAFTENAMHIQAFILMCHFRKLQVVKQDFMELDAVGVPAINAPPVVTAKGRPAQIQRAQSAATHERMVALVRAQSANPMSKAKKTSSNGKSRPRSGMKVGKNNTTNAGRAASAAPVRPHRLPSVPLQSQTFSRNFAKNLSLKDALKLATSVSDDVDEESQKITKRKTSRKDTRRVTDLTNMDLKYHQPIPALPGDPYDMWKRPGAELASSSLTHRVRVHQELGSEIPDILPKYRQESSQMSVEPPTPVWTKHEHERERKRILNWKVRAAKKAKDNVEATAVSLLSTTIPEWDDLYSETALRPQHRPQTPPKERMMPKQMTPEYILYGSPREDKDLEAQLRYGLVDITHRTTFERTYTGYSPSFRHETLNHLPVEEVDRIRHYRRAVFKARQSIQDDLASKRKNLVKTANDIHSVYNKIFERNTPIKRLPAGIHVQTPNPSSMISFNLGQNAKSGTKVFRPASSGLAASRALSVTHPRGKR